MVKTFIKKESAPFQRALLHPSNLAGQELLRAHRSWQSGLSLAKERAESSVEEDTRAIEALLQAYAIDSRACCLDSDDINGLKHIFGWYTIRDPTREQAAQKQPYHERATLDALCYLHHQQHCANRLHPRESSFFTCTCGTPTQAAELLAEVVRSLVFLLTEGGQIAWHAMNQASMHLNSQQAVEVLGENRVCAIYALLMFYQSKTWLHLITFSTEIQKNEEQQFQQIVEKFEDVLRVNPTSQVRVRGFALSFLVVARMRLGQYSAATDNIVELLPILLAGDVQVAVKTYELVLCRFYDRVTTEARPRVTFGELHQLMLDAGEAELAAAAVFEQDAGLIQVRDTTQDLVREIAWDLISKETKPSESPDGPSVTGGASEKKQVSMKGAMTTLARVADKCIPFPKQTAAFTRASSRVACERVTRVCEACSMSGLHLKRCSRCHRVWFCNATCQKKVWKKHKTECAWAIKSHHSYPKPFREAVRIMLLVRERLASPQHPKPIVIPTEIFMHVFSFMGRNWY